MIEFLGLICLTVISVNATPILLLRDKLGLYEMKESNPEWKNRFIELLSCPMCLGFWFGFLFYAFSKPIIITFFLGCIISILSEFVNKLVRR